MGVSNANGDIILDPDGTGKLSVLADNVTITGNGALTLPVGTTAQRSTPNAQGMIRYNTTDSTFEGYDGANWGSLGGVKDVDGDTYIPLTLDLVLMNMQRYIADEKLNNLINPDLGY